MSDRIVDARWRPLLLGGFFMLLAAACVPLASHEADRPLRTPDAERYFSEDEIAGAKMSVGLIWVLGGAVFVGAFLWMQRAAVQVRSASSDTLLVARGVPIVWSRRQVEREDVAVVIDARKAKRGMVYAVCLAIEGRRHVLSFRRNHAAAEQEMRRFAQANGLTC